VDWIAGDGFNISPNSFEDALEFQTNSREVEARSAAPEKSIPG